MVSVIVVAILLLCGALIRARFGWLERARIPASVIAGLLGCAVAQALLATSDRWEAGVQSMLAGFRGASGSLIAIVFAGLLLAPSDRPVHRTQEVWQQGVCAWIIILGQLALGLIATALLIRPFYDVPAPFGQFIEVTMAGGFGSANSMASILESDVYRFPSARDLLVFGATAGLLWGVVSGLVLTQLGVRHGWTQRPETEPGGPESKGSGPFSAAAAEKRVLTPLFEPILLQACFLAVAFGVGLLLQWGVALLSVRLDHLIDSETHRFERHLGDLPLFFFALLGGWIVRAALQIADRTDLLDRDLIHRLSGIAMDVLIVTSLTSIAFNQIRAYLWPVLLLLAIGAAWSVLCLVWLSPRVLPKRYWFELGLINYGFSTAATAQGMMFLKIVDPKLKSGAAETYALGAPLTAPFIGGGVITFLVLPPLIDFAGSIPVAAICLAIIGLLYAVARRLVRRSERQS